MPYEKPFSGKSVGATARTELGLAHYTRTLAPGEAMTLVFKMPHFPVAPKDTAYLAAANAADYDVYRNKTIAYWQNALGKRQPHPHARRTAHRAGASRHRRACHAGHAHRRRGPHADRRPAVSGPVHAGAVRLRPALRCVRAGRVLRGQFSALPQAPDRRRPVLGSGGERGAENPDRAWPDDGVHVQPRADVAQAGAGQGDSSRPSPGPWNSSAAITKPSRTA